MNYAEMSMEQLKAIATDGGIAFKGNISKKDLTALLDKSVSGVVEPLTTAEVSDEEFQGMPPKHAVLDSRGKFSVKPDNSFAALKKRYKESAEKLIKVQVSNLDSAETEIGSVPVVAANQYFTISAVVPFGVICELPTAVVNVLKNTKIQKSRKLMTGVVRDPNSGIKDMTAISFTNKYNVQYING